MWAPFPLDCIFLQLSLNYRNKVDSLWWEARLPLEFWLWALFVSRCLDRLWWQCCQHRRKPATWWHCLWRCSVLSPRECRGHRPLPSLGWDSTPACPHRSSLGIVLGISWMVICMSIAGNGLCHSNLTPRLRELHCGLFSPDLDKLTWNSE